MIVEASDRSSNRPTSTQESKDSVAWIAIAVLACAGVMIGAVWIVVGVWARALGHPVLTDYFVSRTPEVIKGMCGATLFLFAAIVAGDAVRRFFSRKTR